MSNKVFTEKQQENKKEDKKALKSFWLFMILALFIGMVLGFLSGVMRDGMKGDFLDTVIQIARYFGIYGGFVVTTLLGIVSIVLCRKSRKEYTAWDEEEEEVLNRIETRLSYVLWFSNLILYGSYFFFTIGIWATDFGGTKFSAEDFSLLNTVLVLVHMVYALAFGSIIQQKTVNLEKEINPEKSGSVYDMKFDSKWLETCDEAEKFIAYKASYRSFKVTTIVTVILWIICIIGKMSFGLGTFPAVVVTIIMLVQITSYNLQAIYFAKHPSEVMK